MKIECSSNWENEDGRYYEINTLNAWYGEIETGDNRRNTLCCILVGPGKWCNRPQPETMIKVPETQPPGCDRKISYLWSSVICCELKPYGKVNALISLDTTNVFSRPCSWVMYVVFPTVSHRFRLYFRQKLDAKPKPVKLVFQTFSALDIRCIFHCPWHSREIPALDFSLSKAPTTDRCFQGDCQNMILWFRFQSWQSCLLLSIINRKKTQLCQCLLMLLNVI